MTKGTVSRELLIYIDPGFLSDVGHYRNFARNIHEVAFNRDVKIWHFVSNEVSDNAVCHYGLKRIFQYKAFLSYDWSYYRKIVERLRSAQRAAYFKILSPAMSLAKILKLRPHSVKLLIKLMPFVHHSKILEAFHSSMEEILDRVKSECGNRAKVSIFMYTSHPLYFPIFAKLLNSDKYIGLDITAHLSLFYLNPRFCSRKMTPWYVKMLRSVSDMMDKYDPNGRVKIYADSDRTIKLYSPYFERILYLAPIPLFLSAADDKDTPSRNDKEIVIGFFGYTHRKQGYDMVKHLYERLLTMSEYSHVRLIIRHNIHFVTDEMKVMIDDFRSHKEQITHLIGDLKHDEYEAYIASCDVILIPHSRNDYPCQTSGLFVDALRKRKVVIVPDDTWLSDNLESYGSGKTFESDNVEGFINAVREVIDNFDQYACATGSNIEAFSGFHTAESLFNTIGVGVSST